MSGRCISVILLLSCYAITTSCALCNLLDQNSLVSLSSNISSPSPPLNWNFSIDCCSWEGIHCDDYGRVTRLWLPSRGLVGSLSSSIDNLSHLVQLNLSHNFLSGSIPDGLFMSLNYVQIFDLSFNYLLGSSDSLPTTIKTLDLSSNDFEGKMQTSFLQKAVNLMNFNLSYNRFCDPFPMFICNFLPSISVLDFSFNNFYGPFGFGRCLNLKLLQAGYNSLTGPLPDDLFAMTNLKELYLPGNRLSGPIGEGIGNLLNLRILVLHSNQFTGEIPWNLGRLLKLEHLLLHMNKLNGTLPITLRNCARLITMNFGNNSIMGGLSSFNFSKFLQLRIIHLGNNLFTGSFPITLGSCLFLTEIHLFGNQLVGEIPTEIRGLESLSFFSVIHNSLVNIKGAISILSRCQNLSSLALSKNFFHEPLPDHEDLFNFKGFPNIQLLGLGGCQFVGKFPSWIIELPKLQVLDLSQNCLTGELPGRLGNLPSLFYLDLSQNMFSGILPVELTRLPALVSQEVVNENHQISLNWPSSIKRYYKMIFTFPPAIYLNNNNISGAIPTEIGQLKLLLFLNLSHNSFSGNIPDTISVLTNLELLDLSGNYLQGVIPTSLKYLHSLSSFNVADNFLVVVIPFGGQFDNFPITSYLGKPGLCGEILNQSCYKVLATQQPRTKKETDWLSFQSGYGLGFCVSFIVTIVTFATRCSLSSRRSHTKYIVGVFEANFNFQKN